MKSNEKKRNNEGKKKAIVRIHCAILVRSKICVNCWWKFLFLQNKQIIKKKWKENRIECHFCIAKRRENLLHLVCSTFKCKPMNCQQLCVSYIHMSVEWTNNVFLLLLLLVWRFAFSSSIWCSGFIFFISFFLWSVFLMLSNQHPARWNDMCMASVDSIQSGWHIQFCLFSFTRFYFLSVHCVTSVHLLIEFEALGALERRLNVWMKILRYATIFNFRNDIV